VHANIPSYAALFKNYDYTSSFYKRDANEKLAAGMWVLVLTGLSCFFPSSIRIQPDPSL
jgi:hypothetical protein